MSVDVIVARPQPRLAELDAELGVMMARLKMLAEGPQLEEQDLTEIAAIYNNVSYLFLYLESNAAHVSFDCLQPWKGAFYSDATLDAKMLRGLEALRCSDAEAEAARLAYVRYFSEKLSGNDAETVGALEAVRSQAAAIGRQIRAEQAKLLHRLGIYTPDAQPETTFYNLIRAQQSMPIRSKLARAWLQARSRWTSTHIEAVDCLVEARCARSVARGFDSARTETFTRCGVSAAQATGVLGRYLEGALQSQGRLDAEVRNLVGPCDRPMDHFEFYVSSLQSGMTIPLFLLDDCLEFIFAVAEKTFGLSFNRINRGICHAISVDVSREGRDCGQINFDLWDNGGAQKSANQTLGARNRMECAEIVQQPVAYVSCRFKSNDDSARRITFQNLHSLFHEFGHAINHLLIRRRFPNQSGLEYLPLERLESLSMWFERWVFHPELAKRLPLSADERVGLHLAQHIKTLEYRRTHVDRAVTAALDYEVNGPVETSVAAAFKRLDASFGISAACEIDDFLPYFNLPMLQANPGGYFSYLWGAAESAERFLPLLSLEFDALPGPEVMLRQFSNCFDFDEPSVEPSTAAAFAFYEPAPAAPQRGAV